MENEANPHSSIDAMGSTNQTDARGWLEFGIIVDSHGGVAGLWTEMG
jgi:hypothetical protein